MFISVDLSLADEIGEHETSEGTCMGGIQMSLTDMVENVYAVAFSPDGKYLAVGVHYNIFNYDHLIYIYDMSNWTLVKTIDPFPYGARSFAFSYDSKWLAVGQMYMGGGSKCYIYNTTDWSVVESFNGGVYSMIVWSVDFSQDCKYVAYALYRPDDYMVKIHNTSDWSHIATLDEDDPYNPITSVSFSQDNEHIAYGSYDNKVYIHDVSDWSLNTTLTESEDDINSVVFSPNNKYVVYGGADNKVYVHDVSDWSLVTTLTESTDDINSVVFSPNNEYVVYGGADNKLYVHDVSDWSLVTTLTESTDDINSIDFSYDSNLIAYGSKDTNTYIFNIFNVTRTIGGDSPEQNSFSFSLPYNYSVNITYKVPISNDMLGIINVTNNTCGTLATEVDTADELVNNTFWYDPANQYVYIRSLGHNISTIVNWTVRGSTGVTFNLIIPPYLEVGQYFHSEGFISDSDGNAVSGMIAETRLLYANGTDALSVNPKHNCTNGNYHCTFSTSTLLPGTYSVSIEFTDPSSGIVYKKGSTLYLSVDPGSGIYVSTFLHFTFYNNNTGIGIPSESFKLYASTDTIIDSTDRIYTDLFGVYTGQTIYYRVDDYFNNQIYPSTGSYQTLEITSLEQFEDIPIDWYSFSVKNMNHSIVHFKMTNGSRTYPQYLYPYEPFYWDILPGEYTINLTYYNPIDDSIVSYTEENITTTDDTYYWIRGYDLRDIIIEITAVNSTIDTLFLNIDVDLSLINSNVTNLNSFISEIWNSQNSSFGSVNSILISFWDNQNVSFSSINQTILAFWDSQNTTFGTVSSNLMSIWNSQNTSFGNVDTILFQVWSAENSSYENITNSLTQIWISQNTSFSDINNVIVQFWSTQNSSFDNVRNDITQFWLGANNSFQNVENHISSMWINFNSTFGSVNQTLISFWNNVNTSFDTVTNTVLNIWDSQNTSFGEVTDVVLSFWNVQNSSFDELTVFINTHLNYINNSINVSFIGINTKLDVLYNDMNISFIYTNTLINFSYNSIVQNITSLNLTMYNKMMEILNNVEQAGESVFNKTVSVLDNLTQVYINLSDDIVTETLNVILNVTATITNDTISILDAIDDVISQVDNTGDIISGLREIMDDALTPDVTIVSRNPIMIYSIYDTEGAALGESYTICPPLITIATTRVTQYGNFINSTPMIPGNGSALNGTITIIRDTLYMSGSASWVNITYTDNGTTFSNESFVSSRIDIYGENLTINASGDLSVLRVTKYHQVRKFDWTVYPFSGHGYDLDRAWWHEAGIEIINPMSVNLYEVYVIAGFPPETSVDGSSVEIRDTTNGGVILEKGPDYDVTDTSVHFATLCLVPYEHRAFTIGFYKLSADSYTYDEGTFSVPSFEITTYDGKSYNFFPVHWTNPYDRTFRGALYVKLNFNVPIGIDTTSMRIYDLTNDHELDPTAFIPGDKYIRISSEGMGDVLPGSSRKFDVYFLMEEFPGADPTELHLNTQLWMGVSLFLIILLAGVCFIIAGVALVVADKKEKRDRWKVCAAMGVFIVVVIIVLQSMGL